MAQWKSRKAEPEKHSGEQVYFFKKAYDEFVNSASDDFPISLMNQVEKEIGISHTPEFDALTQSHKNVDAPESGRLCELIKSGTAYTLLEELSKDALNWNDGLAFVDLCAVLGEVKLGALFATQNNKHYDILEYVKSTSDPGSIRSTLLTEAARIFMESSPENRDAARLTRIIFSCVASDPAHRNLALAELWSEGYHWDAYCLATILCPEERNTTLMRTRLEKFVQPMKSGKVHKIVELLELIKKNGAVGYKDQLLQDVDPIQLYRILKMDMIRNEKAGNNHELQKLSIRGQNSEALRRVILAALIRTSSSDAYTIAHDAVHFIRNQGEAISDYFKGPERLLFESTVFIIGSMLEALQLLLHKKTSQMFGNAGDNTVLEALRNIWNKRIPDISSGNGQLHRDLFARSAELFTPELDTVKQHLGRNEVENEVLVSLAIKLACIMLTTSLHLEKSEVAAAARGCGLKDEQIAKISAGLFQKADDAAFEEPVISDGGANFKKELQSSGIETNWIRPEVNDMSQITAGGDTMEVGQEEADSRESNSYVAQAKALVGSENSEEIAAKQNVARKESPSAENRKDETEKTENSSDSSVTGSASNYATHEPEAPVQQTAKPVEKHTPAITPVQAPKPAPSVPTMQFACGGFDDYEAHSSFGKVPDVAQPAPRGFGPREPSSYGGHRGGGFGGRGRGRGHY